MAVKRDRVLRAVDAALGPEPQKAAIPTKPTIILEQQDDGGWRVLGNVKNPERMVRLLGAQLVIKNEQ